MPPELSIVIRAYNEAEKLERLLKSLSHQSLATEKWEVVVVNNGSTDQTAAIAQKYGATVVYLDQDKFSYPLSSNMGIQQAKGRFIMMISAHCLPVRNNFLERGLKHFENSNLAGLYGPTLPEKDSPLFEKLMATPQYLKSLFHLPTRRVTYSRVGFMGATNCILRKDLWEKLPFNEAYGAGNEDSDWGAWALSQGYTILFDPLFTVYHSHYLATPSQFVKQHRLWRSIHNHPRPFNRSELNFRLDMSPTKDKNK